MFFQRHQGIIWLFSGFVCLATLLIFAICFLIGLQLGVLSLNISYNLPAYFLALVVGSLGSSKYFSQERFTLPVLNRLQSLSLAYRQIFLIACSIFLVLFITKDTALSRQFLVATLFVLGGCLVFINYAIPPWIARLTCYGKNSIPTLLVGSERHLKHLDGWLQHKQVLGLLPVGIINNEPKMSPNTVLPRLGKIEELPDLIRVHGIKQVLVLGGVGHASVMRKIVDDCTENGCRLLIYNNLLDTVDHPLVCVNELHHNFFSLQYEPLENVFNRMLKRIFDLFIAAGVIVTILGPLALLVSLFQRQQAPGKLFYCQERGGRNGGTFKIYKFRTMYERSPTLNDTAQQASSNDPRIYPFGAFLRRTSLDEIPQFLNVLRGEMSVVGPRPHLSEHDEIFARQAKLYKTRHFVKPGITGLAQAEGLRGECHNQQMLEARIRRDVHYLTNWSLLMDIYIVAKTAWQVIKPPRTAY